MKWKNVLAAVAGLTFISVLALLVTIRRPVSAQEHLSSSSLVQQVILLTNEERAKAGLPPLKENPLLMQAAQAHAQAMAERNFFDHVDPQTKKSPGDRLSAAGYRWSVMAENIEAGPASAEEAISKWMGSPAHRVNILNPLVREIGVGYVFDAKDTFPSPAAPYCHYWVQNFGADRDVFPLIINNEAPFTITSTVTLYIYGEGWASEMRLRNDEQPFGAWQPFSSSLSWELPKEEGLHTVSVELRDNTGQVRTASDSIYFSRTPLPTPTPLPTSLPTPSPTPISAPLQSDGVVTLKKEVAPVTPLLGGEVTINLSLSADPSICGKEISGKPPDVILVIDHSGSMDNLFSWLFDTHKLTKAKEAACAFVDEMRMDNDRVGVVQFNEHAELLQPLTHDAKAVKAAINGIVGGGGTAIDEGLRVAREELIKNGVPDHAPVIVILSDGISDRELAVAAAEDAKKDGIRIVTVGIGWDVDEATMREIASGPEDYYFSPDASDLKEIYISIAQQIREFAAATNVEIRHTFDLTRLEIIPNSISHGGVLTGDTARNVITWKLSKLGEHPVTLTYKGRVRQQGAYFLDVRDQITYIVCEREARAFVGEPRLLVQVSEPTFTPTSTFSPTPPWTPTPTDIPTLAGVFVTPAPIPTATRAWIDRIPRPSRPSFCASRNWWVPALLLPFLLVLLIVLLLWWWFHRNNVAWYNLWKEWGWPCRILSILSLLYALFLAFLIGRELFAGICTPAEAVYFWRMDRGHGEYGIFLTRPDEGAQPVPFQALNRQRCVGCHAVSSSSRRIAAVVGPIPAHALVYTLSGEPVTIPNIDAIYCAWAPDGSKMAFSDSRGDIHILDLQTGSVTPLAGASTPQFSETMPAWSADGQTIAFVRSPYPLNVGGASVEGSADIYTVPATGGDPAPLVGASGDGLNYYPAYSPDGRWLAFTRHTTGKSSYSDAAAEIYLVPAAGGEARRLAANDAPDGTPLRNVSNSWPTWSRDGRLLAFNSKRNDPAFDVFVTEIDGNGNSGPAMPLSGASFPGVFEHTPFWGAPLQIAPFWLRLWNLWPWVLPLLILALLRWLLCRQRRPKCVFIPMPPVGKLPTVQEPPSFLSYWRPPPPEWDPLPALVVGLGGTGRWVLTHLKKNLLDAGLGKERERVRVRLLLLDTAHKEIVQGREIPVRVGDVELSDEEKLIVGDDLGELIRRMERDPLVEPEMQSWFPAREYIRVRQLPSAQMDIRLGTMLRRPMGRAVVFQDAKRGEASRLWQALTSAMRALAQEEGARVIIVGSICGGFGGAVLADVAYLARRAAQAAGPRGAGIAISALLATDSTFSSAPSPSQLRLNSMATLRELARLQLARGVPYPMVYDRGQRDKAFNGYIEWPLLDDVFIFDERLRSPLTSYAPEKAMFPLMADLITAFVDRGSRLIEEIRANIRTDAINEQLARGEPVVAALGGYGYHLPMRDLARGLELRFAHDLLLLYLAGPEFRGETVELSPDQCQEKYPGGLQVMADHFLRGKMFEEDMGVGGATTYVADLAMGSGVQAEWESLARSARSHSEGREGFIRKEADRFRDALTATLLRLLNGRPEEADLSIARTRKLGYAQAFLEEVSKALERAEGRAEYLESQVSSDLKDGHAVLLALVRREREALRLVRDDFARRVAFLLGEKPSGRLEQQPSLRGVLDILRERLHHEEKWREEMRSICVRHTFAEEAFFDELYRRYFAPRLTESLDRLFWRAEADGGISFVLRHWEDVAFTTDASGQEKFIAALLELAAASGQDIWRLRLDPFFDDEEKGLWSKQAILGEAQNALLWGEPVVEVRPGRAREQKLLRYLWVNASVLQRDQFRYEVQRIANMREEVQRLDATDPYRAMLITSLDVLPLSALACTERLENDYKNAHRLSAEAARGPADRRPEPIHVFAAERHALSYEQRLPELREAPRLFHPLFVAALEDLERARSFVLAYVLGWIQRASRQERGFWRSYYVLALPGAEEIPLTWADDPNDTVALVVRAMQGFVLGHPNGSGPQSRYDAFQLAALVRDALKRELPRQMERLRAFLRAPEVPEDRRLGASDFLSFAQMIVIDELRAAGAQV